MLYLLDYGAGNVASLANSVRKLGYEFKWVQTPEDIDKADVRPHLALSHGRAGRAQLVERRGGKGRPAPLD
ncbi:hypothetical protein JCM8208_001586 [Rhodotorula glutinis]